MVNRLTEGHCNQCGMCCKAIRLKFRIQDRYWEGATGDIGFVHDNWEEITYEQACKINPHMLDNGKKFTTEHFYYTCKKFDSETNRCTVHEQRPYVCRDYPWYDDGVHLYEPFYSSTCGYKIDQEPLIQLRNKLMCSFELGKQKIKNGDLPGLKEVFANILIRFDINCDDIKEYDMKKSEVEQEYEDSL